MNVACPACQRIQLVPILSPGGTVQCVFCRTAFRIPESISEPPPPSVAATISDSAAADTDEADEADEQDSLASSPWLGILFIGSIGLLLLVALVIGVLFAKGKLSLPDRHRAATTARAAQERVKPHPTHEPSESLEVEAVTTGKVPWTDAREYSLIMHRVKVVVEHVEIGPVRRRSDAAAGAVADSQNYLTIFLTLRNLGDFPLDYATWYRAGGSQHTRHRPVTLTDNLGRSYSIKKFPPAEKVGGVTEATRLPVGVEVDEVLVFSLPPDGLDEVKSFLLTLPAQAFGGEGLFRYEIPLLNGRGW